MTNDNKQSIKRIWKLSIRTGEYEKDWVKKNQYHTCWTLFKNVNSGNLSIKIDSLPTTWRNSRVNIFLEDWFSISVNEKVVDEEVDSIFWE